MARVRSSHRYVAVDVAIALLSSGCINEADAPSASPSANHEPFPTALPTVDLSDANTAACPTPFTAKRPSDLHLFDYSDWSPWYEHDDLWASPDDSHGGRWYIGGIYVVRWTGAAELLNVIGRPLNGGDAALAVVSALTISVRLRTLGISAHAVLASVAVVAGAIVGIATARLVATDFDISIVTGIGQPVAQTPDWFTAWLIVGMIVMLAGAVVLFSVIDRRAHVGQSLRLGDE